jgi:hypothetical protein
LYGCILPSFHLLSFFLHLSVLDAAAFNDTSIPRAVGGYSGWASLWLRRRRGMGVRRRRGIASWALHALAARLQAACMPPPAFCAK